MDKITPIDTGYIRESVKDIGDLLQNVQSARMAEISALISMTATARTGLELVNAMDSASGLGGNVDFTG